MCAQRFRVLVVEDDRELNELECDLLGVHGMETVPAFSGTEAVEVCEQCGFDAVLLDIMLPNKDGFETCRQLRHSAGGRLPIIMITALDSDDCRQRGMEAGANAYFTKPFDPDEVVAKVLELVNGCRHPHSPENGNQVAPDHLWGRAGGGNGS